MNSNEGIIEEQKVEILQILTSFDEVIANLDPSRVVKGSVRFIADSLNLHHVSIALLNEERTGFIIMDTGFSIETIEQGDFFPLDKAAIHKAVEQRSPFYRPDMRKSERVYEIDEKLLRTGIVSEYVVPLIVGNKIVGTLNSGSTDVRGISKEKRQILQLLAPRLAQAIQNSLLYKTLQEKEDRFRSIYEQSPIAIEIYDSDGKLVDVNPQCLRLFGIDNVEEVIDFKLFEDPNVPKDIRERLANSEAVVYESVFDFDLVREKNLYRTSKSGKCYLNVHMTPLGADRTGPDGYLVQVIDITDRKKGEQEREKLHKKIRQSEKMQVVGQLAGGIAHRFNNNLAAIAGYAEMVLDDIKKDAKLSRYVNSIMASARRSADLTYKLLAFARRGKYQIIEVDVHDIVIKVISLMKENITKRVKVSKHLNVDPALVMGDPTQLQEALLNIAMNAYEAVGEKGKILITTNLVEIDNTFIAAKEYKIAPGNYVKIGVNDNGIGMDKETQKRIFEPFYTSKDQSSRSGMGLSAAFGIIKNHNGAIDVYSEIGKGSTFNIYLPVITVKTEARKEKVKEEPPTEVQGHILLVEEDDILREMTSLLLQGIGYIVTECKTGADAIEIYKNKYDEIDIAYLDMALTEMSAREALNAMREINPSVKALFSSSFSLTDEIEELIKGKNIVGFVQKPFKINELSAVIEDAMKR